MPTILQLRRGSTAENDAYTGSVGEITVDTTLSTVRLHDGSNAGGSLVGNLQKNIQIGITGDNEIDTSSGNLTIDSAGGTVTIDDNLNISGTTTVSGHILPDTDVTYDLGSSSFKFRDIYLSGTSINLGSATITATGSSIVLPSGSTISGGTGNLATENYVDTAVANVIDSAPGALNTLNELAAALGDDANYASTTTTALSNRLRIDTNAQGLTSTQKSNAITNLGLSTVATSGSYTDLSNTSSVVTLTGSQTLTNKTLVSPVISSISNTGTLTLPTSTGTVALTSDIPAGYTDSDVDTHLNTSTASSGEVLSWTGSDYDWVAQSAGGGTGNLTITGTTITAPVNSNITLDPSGTGFVETSGDVRPAVSFTHDLGDPFAAWANTYTNQLFIGTTLFLNYTAGQSGQVVQSQGSGSSTIWTTLKTVNGTSILGSGDIAAGGGTSWQTVKTSAFTAVAGEGYFVNTTSAAITVTLPASPTLGDEVTIVDYAGTADTNNITVARNGENIQGSAADLTVSVERAAFTLVYTDGTQGWLLKDK